MFRFVILSLALIALINSSNIPRTTATPPGIRQNDKTFVQIACKTTRFPPMCYNALSPYSSIIKSNPIKLCLTALSVNLKSAKSASSIASSLIKKFASRPEVPSILKVCLKEMKYTADRLEQVIAKSMTSPRITKEEIKRKLEMWAMPASIKMTTCMNKLKEVKVNNNTEVKKAKKAVSELSMTTRNTLALCKV